jgi:hypothetical protein
VSAQPVPEEFKEVYRYMTTVQGNRFRFRGGDPLTIRTKLERLLADRFPGQTLRVRFEG